MLKRKEKLLKPFAARDVYRKEWSGLPVAVAKSQRIVNLQSGEFIIKYGTTSERLKNDRIREVSASWKATAKVLAMVKTLEPATLIEQTASQIGRRLTHDYSRRDGWTEFRVVNKDELIQLMSIADAVAEYKIVWNNITTVIYS